MDVNKLFRKACKQIKGEFEQEFVDEIKDLLEKRHKAQLVLDNIDREIQDKKLELTHKTDAIMSRQLSGIQSECD